MTPEPDDPPETVVPNPRRERPSLEGRHSVLTFIASKTGEAPRVSLPEEDSGGAPPIDPGSPERQALPEGRGAYTILGEIARGGMGVVMRGHDVDLGRDVAMKVLAKELAERPEVVQRFVEEAQIGGQLQHPGIVPVYELGLMADERPYFTMKLVKGRTLATLLAERASPEADRARILDVFLSICQTMAYAHSRGVIHRDLKPANVMVGAFGEVQVVDWGLAKVLARGGTADEERAEAVRTEFTVLETVRTAGSQSGRPGSSTGTDSVVGSVLGTPAYMPPEQASGQVDRLDERSDVFALGAMLCEILTGAPPYVKGVSANAVVQLAAQGELDDAYARLDACGADAGLVKIAKQCLVAAKVARPRNAGVVAESVHAHIASVAERARTAELEAVEARVNAAAERRARRLTLALAASVLGLVAAGGGAWVYKERLVRESERVARAEELRLERALDDVFVRVQDLQTEGLVEEAATAADGALVLVADRSEDDAQRTRAESLVAQAHAQLDRVRAEEAESARDDAFLEQLEEVRLLASDASTGGDFAAVDEAFRQAFLDWELDIDADIEASLERMRASRISDDIAPALDDWAATRRLAYGWKAFEAESLTSLAADLDPDPTRNFLREALIELDAETLLEMARDPAVVDNDPSTLLVLGNALRELRDALDEMEFLRQSIRLFERAVARYPGDLRLRVAAARATLDVPMPSLGLPHASVAATLRPDSRALAISEGRMFKEGKRYPAALRCFQRLLDRNPRDRQVIGLAAECHFELGEHERVIELLERLQSRSTMQEISLEVARFLVDRIDLPTLELRLAALPDSDALLAAAWALQLPPHAEGNADEIERILAKIPARSSRSSMQWAKDSVHATLALERGRPEEALDWCTKMCSIQGLPPSHTRWLDVMYIQMQAYRMLGREAEMRTTATMLFDNLILVLADELWRWEGTRMMEMFELADELDG